MTVSSRSLIGRVFLWNYTHLVDHQRAGLYLMDGTNLCHLIRTVFVVVPLKVLGMSVIAAALAFALELPFLHYGWDGLKVYGIFGAVALVGCLIWLRWCGLRHLEQTCERPQSLMILAAWVAAKKARICPLVTFDDRRRGATQ